ncbi:amidohydrolase family protein [Halomonas sp. NPDC076908]|uniref:amidohydrolase family protein n=1 Tax=Halomonas sp. NPDC076908 TaxID=3390567 RepID=UPI003CFC5B05
MSWPEQAGQSQRATVRVERGAFAPPCPMQEGDSAQPGALDLGGRLVLPPLIDPHVHMDKTYTRQRLGALQPGLLNAISAMRADQDMHWSHADLTARSERALNQAYQAGTRLIRSHVDWSEPTEIPLAWSLLAEQRARWQHKIRLQRVALVPLGILEDIHKASFIVQQVAASTDAAMGAFIHSSNFNASAMRNLVELAAEWRVDLDLHIDEELSRESKGLECLLDVLEARTEPFCGRIVCGHLCSLANKEYHYAVGLLERAAKQPITFLMLPTSNLFLQDAHPGHTPRKRGLTLLKEAHARGINCLLGSDNVQDAFYPFGNYDPVEILRLGVLSAHLEDAFDTWSQAICSTIGLDGQLASSNKEPTQEWILFDTDSPWCWPSDLKRIRLHIGTCPIATTLFYPHDTPWSRS